MSTPNILPPRILIVGAGAMGMIMGYMLDRVGAAITYLVRPHRLEALGRPQMLYSYDDNRLAAYTSYDCISDPGTSPIAIMIMCSSRWTGMRCARAKARH